MSSRSKEEGKGKKRGRRDFAFILPSRTTQFNGQGGGRKQHGGQPLGKCVSRRDQGAGRRRKKKGGIPFFSILARQGGREKEGKPGHPLIIATPREERE